MKKIILIVAALFALAACGPACPPDQTNYCTTRVGTGIGPKGEVVTVVIPVCVCVSK